MAKRSLSRTLAIRYGLTMGVALLAIGLAAYAGVSAIIERELDNGLLSIGDVQLDMLAEGNPLGNHRGHREADGFVRSANRLSVVRDSSGAVIQMNDTVSAALPLAPGPFHQARAGQAAWSTDNWDHGRVRSLYLPTAPGNPSHSAVLQVAASLESLAQTRHAMLLGILAAVILGTSATTIGAGWLARRTMAPLSAITSQAEGITPGVTGHRITVHADIVEYEGLIAVLNAMLARLDHAFEWQRRIIADLCHELRTPLSAMRAGTELALRARREPAAYRMALLSNLEEIQRLSTMSDALLLLARFDSGELTASPSWLELDPLLGEAVKRARAATQDHSIAIQGPPPGPPLRINADPRLLGFLLHQLLDNALRHTPPGTTVEVARSRRAEEVTIAVEDDGPGIPEAVAPHLFERFFRADPARSRTGGAGLGLTLASAIVALHGGSIAAERGSKGGLRVVIVLPRRGPFGAAEPASDRT